MPVFLETSKQSIGKLFDTKFDPAIVKLPEVKANNESNIAGLFIIGEVSGIPLIKLGLNQGNRLINQLFENKAPKGRRSKAWEWMNAAILVWAFVATVLICGNMFFGKIYHNDIYHWFGFLSQVGEKSRHWYGYIADFWLVGVIPVTLYPFYGGKVWCRYWCPLAKWMEFWSHRFSKLKISRNEKFIICGECSRYCEVGIDVMSFAKNQEDFSNKNTSCIQCGICITVCPLDVLSFQNDRKVNLINL